MADDDPLEGEHAFLRRLCGRLNARSAPPHPGAQLLVGAGDDAAVFQPGSDPLAVTTDTLVEGVHFRSEWLSPRALGVRSTEVNLSDLAAMAARPRFLLAAVSAPAGTSSEWLDALLEGCAEASEAAGASLIGGNLARAGELSVTITAIGEIPGRRLDRTGAQPGDDLIVTGSLGDAAAAVAAWRNHQRPADEQRERWIRPRARIRAALVLAEAGAHAAIDLSDGLMGDLAHVCEASRVGAEIERERLPRTPGVAKLDREGNDFAATGGEDYELLVACPRRVTSDLHSLAEKAEVPLTIVGRCTNRPGEVALLGADHAPMARPGGFDHFTRAPHQG